MKYFIIFLALSCSHLNPIDSAIIHPVFDSQYVCSEHYAGQLKELGDALGTDCIYQSFVEQDGRKWLRAYKNEGHKNQDWFGWQKNVLSPISGEVVRINLNEVVNKPGIMGKGMASFVMLKGDDGLFVLLAHLQNIKVSKGDKVEAGEVLGLVGNNGQSWHPHIHIGAWKDNKPLQIRFDQEAMAKFKSR
ncbi:MAG: hypothetical protein COW01_15745 [Bdellovibrionales bacterium CG12_big_fil_rev_8_21_14_0_65_38_15]|nr:MAG: hypothetical protein COW79_14910 [Bdellovibrionales bacterium CG22_combo_CG10-13_8_21_14_all_38_13]PIQ52422.1 MAG: hypothetical protein COW01_15745 [Bdellovibrionales bacterium CG12_big_fil_rev_8_21_14_0_65_38_15]PIR29460.1 MAG: hypothetical protein COV38_10285 [Bdellovibrionales bacterium CG11_big_fil_rev_8_21_14_0_20_38_13]